MFFYLLLRELIIQILMFCRDSINRKTQRTERNLSSCA